MNVFHVEMDGLEDGPYHLHVAGFNYFHQILAKDQEYGGKSFLDTDIFYSTELKLMFYIDNTPFEIWRIGQTGR